MFRMSSYWVFIMALFRLLRSSAIYLRKEWISTASVLRVDVDNLIEEKLPESVDENEPNDPRDRTTKISVETSIEYLMSDAYKKAYGDLPVWTYYVRNFKGGRAPDTRRNCITKGRINNASPCPICRDEYLVVDYRNVDLIKQFISPYGGNLLDTLETGVCQAQHKQLIVAIKKAKDMGFISFYVPHRAYDYSLYFKK